MQTSPDIKNITAAVVGFQKEVGKIEKDSTNPFFKSFYASLSGILDAISKPLTNNGLALVQFPEGENGLTTRLIHTSGEWMESTYQMSPVKNTPQDRGSVLTYMRRYAIGAILSLNVSEDDDGNAASQPPKQQPANKPQPQPAPILTPMTDIEVTALIEQISKCGSVDTLNNLYATNKTRIGKHEGVIKAFGDRKKELTQPVNQN